MQCEVKNYERYTDEELVALLIKGDRNAFEAIYRRYASDMYRYVRRNINVKEDCEEMLQDFFESLWLRHDILKINSLRHYVYNSMRYMIIRYIQHRGVEKRYVDYYTAFSSIYDVAESHDPKALQDLLLKSLEGLSERCQMAMRLRLQEDLSNAEIAKRMNISKGTVELYMCKALAHLRSTKQKLSTRIELAIGWPPDID